MREKTVLEQFGEGKGQKDEECHAGGFWTLGRFSSLLQEEGDWLVLEAAGGTRCPFWDIAT